MRQGDHSELSYLTFHSTSSCPLEETHRRPYNDRGMDVNGMNASQTEERRYRHESRILISLQKLLERTQSRWYPDFAFLVFGPMRKWISAGFETIQFVSICYSSHRKLIECFLMYTGSWQTSTCFKYYSIVWAYFKNSQLVFQSITMHFSGSFIYLLVLPENDFYIYFQPTIFVCCFPKINNSK